MKKRGELTTAAESAAEQLRQKIAARAQRPPQGEPLALARPSDQLCSPNCPICNGIGWVRYDVGMDDDRFGVIDPCPKRPPENRKARTYTGLYMRDIDRTWADLIPEPMTLLIRERTINSNAVKLAKLVRDHIRDGFGMVYLYGGYGIAKSLILKIAVAERARANQPGQYRYMTDIVDSILDGFDFSDPREGARARFERWAAHPFLAIDEIDKVALNSEWVAERFWKFIDRRYEDAAEYERSVTLIASNKRPHELDGALADRISDGRVLYIEISGESMRSRLRRSDGGR